MGELLFYAGGVIPSVILTFAVFWMEKRGGHPFIYGLLTLAFPIIVAPFVFAKKIKVTKWVTVPVLFVSLLFLWTISVGISFGIAQAVDPVFAQKIEETERESQAETHRIESEKLAALELERKKQEAERKEEEKLQHDREKNEQREQNEKKALNCKTKEVIKEALSKGIIGKIDCSRSKAWIDPYAWNGANVDAKKDIGMIAAMYCACEQEKDTLYISILSYRDDRELATYDPLFGFKIKN